LNFYFISSLHFFFGLDFGIILWAFLIHRIHWHSSHSLIRILWTSLNQLKFALSIGFVHPLSSSLCSRCNLIFQTSGVNHSKLPSHPKVTHGIDIPAHSSHSSVSFLLYPQHLPTGRTDLTTLHDDDSNAYERTEPHGWTNERCVFYYCHTPAT